MSFDHVNRISEERAKIWEQAKALLDAAADQSRNLDGEEQAQFDRMTADLDALDATRAQLLDAIQRDRDIEESRTRVGLQAVLTGEPVADDEAGPDLNAAVRSMFHQGGRVEFEQRDSTTATSNINTVPTDILPQWVVYYTQGNVLREVSTVITTEGGNPLNIPTVSARSTATIVGEGSAISESDPTYAARTLNSYKVAVALQYSRELAQDSGVPIADMISAQLGEALGVATRAYFTTGTGSSQPRGVVLDATNSSITGGTGVSGAPSGDNIIDLYHAVPIGARQSAGFRFMCNSTTLGQIRKLKASGSGEYVFSTGLYGNPDTILGRPVLVNESVASGLSAKNLLAGDFSKYYVREVGGMVIEADTSVGFLSDLITVKATMRTDGVLTDRSAVVYMTGGAS